MTNEQLLTKIERMVAHLDTNSLNYINQDEFGKVMSSLLSIYHCLYNRESALEMQVTTDAISNYFGNYRLDVHHEYMGTREQTIQYLERALIIITNLI